MALLPLYATPLGLGMLAIGSTIGLAFRIAGAKAENDQWKNFYEKTEEEKKRVMSYLGIQDKPTYTCIMQTSGSFLIPVRKYLPIALKLYVYIRVHHVILHGLHHVSRFCYYLVYTM